MGQIELDGQLISLQEFNNMKSDPNKRFKEVAPGKYITLTKLHG